MATKGIPFPSDLAAVREDIISSRWLDETYKAKAMACFVHGVYVSIAKDDYIYPPELCWDSFNYKVTKELCDAESGRIFGVVLEWDKGLGSRICAPMKPPGAPMAVIALRGTHKNSRAIWREKCYSNPDIQSLLMDLDLDFSILWKESLEPSSRFQMALQELEKIAKKYGHKDVCLAGHSLGAAIAIEVAIKFADNTGKAVETHAFNPPARPPNLHAQFVKELRSAFTYKHVLPYSRLEVSETKSVLRTRVEMVDLRLYVHRNDPICKYYIDVDGSHQKGDPPIPAKLIVSADEDKRLLDGHALTSWFESDLVLETRYAHDGSILEDMVKIMSVNAPNLSKIRRLQLQDEHCQTMEGASGLH